MNRLIIIEEVILSITYEMTVEKFYHVVFAYWVGTYEKRNLSCMQNEYVCILRTHISKRKEPLQQQCIIYLHTY